MNESPNKRLERGMNTLRVPKYGQLEKVYTYGPASPSSYMLEQESTSSISSVNEMYDVYRTQKHKERKLKMEINIKDVSLGKL